MLEVLFFVYFLVAIVGVGICGIVAALLMMDGDRHDAIVAARISLAVLAWPVVVPAGLIWLAFQKI